MRRRTILILAALAAALCFLVTSLAEAPRSAYEQYLEDGSFPSLKERYQDTFLIGVAVPENLLSNRQASRARWR